MGGRDVVETDEFHLDPNQNQMVAAVVVVVDHLHRGRGHIHPEKPLGKISHGLG